MYLRFPFFRALFLAMGFAHALTTATALAQQPVSPSAIEPQPTPVGAVHGHVAIEQSKVRELQKTSASSESNERQEPSLQSKSADSAATRQSHQPDFVDSTQNHANRNQCADPILNSYRKSIAFASFPRLIPASSNAGALYQVDQQLPRLLGDNLRKRHATLTPIHLAEGLSGAEHSDDIRVAAQAQSLAKKHRTQFIVSGEVQDMSMAFPGTAYSPGLYTRFINGAHNLLHINTPLDKRDRIFAFHLQLRDGFTGQILFDNHYQTFGKWKAVRPAEIGFGSPRFWKSDYGKQIQHLVAKASDELAATIDCQPYIARVESRPGKQQVIIRSGANNGLRAGDAMELYQLVVQQAAGEYQFFDTRLVRLNAAMRLTEVYPSHSVAQVSDDILLSGQYLALAP